jgi:hypothetical protein
MTEPLVSEVLAEGGPTPEQIRAGVVLVQVGWMHPAYGDRRILDDREKEALESRAPGDKTYVSGFIAVYRALASS